MWTPAELPTPACSSPSPPLINAEILVSPVKLGSRWEYVLIFDDRGHLPAPQQSVGH